MEGFKWNYLMWEGSFWGLEMFKRKLFPVVLENSQGVY